MLLAGILLAMAKESITHGVCILKHVTLGVMVSRHVVSPEAVVISKLLQRTLCLMLELALRSASAAIIDNTRFLVVMCPPKQGNTHGIIILEHAATAITMVGAMVVCRHVLGAKQAVLIRKLLQRAGCGHVKLALRSSSAAIIDNTQCLVVVVMCRPAAPPEQGNTHGVGILEHAATASAVVGTVMVCREVLGAKQAVLVRNDMLQGQELAGRELVLKRGVIFRSYDSSGYLLLSA